jgi:hypothetical protein
VVGRRRDWRKAYGPLIFTSCVYVLFTGIWSGHIGASLAPNPSLPFPHGEYNQSATCLRLRLRHSDNAAQHPPSGCALFHLVVGRSCRSRTLTPQLPWSLLAMCKAPPAPRGHCHHLNGNHQFPCSTDSPGQMWKYPRAITKATWAPGNASTQTKETTT